MSLFLLIDKDEFGNTISGDRNDAARYRVHGDLFAHRPTVVFCRPSAVPIAEPRAGQGDELLEPGSDLRIGIVHRRTCQRSM